MTPAELRGWYGLTFPIRDWNGQCQAAVVHASRASGGFSRYYLTATDAWLASAIVSHDPATAPAGAVHYWDIPDPHGHVALDLWGSGAQLLHGAPSDLIQDAWGINLGTASFEHVAASRPRWAYRGWSLTNGQNLILLDHAASAAVAPPPKGHSMKAYWARDPETGQARHFLIGEFSATEYDSETFRLLAADYPAREVGWWVLWREVRSAVDRGDAFRVVPAPPIEVALDDILAGLAADLAAATAAATADELASRLTS